MRSVSQDVFIPLDELRQSCYTLATESLRERGNENRKLSRRRGRGGSRSARGYPRWVIGRKEGAPNFAMRVAELDPGSASPLHTHQEEHEVFVLSGSGKVRAGGKQAELAEGDVVFIQPLEEHTFINDGEELLRFICVIPLLRRQ
jgi:quercetin dioxygenase-like cupin family protein